MRVVFSSRLIDDVANSVRAALTTHGIVNVPVLAEEIRRRNEAENIALEDITAQIVAHAQMLSAAMEFESGSLNCGSLN
jgi:RNA-binding protein YhbY